MPKLIVHRAGASSDKNEGKPKPYADTQRRQSYTNGSLRGQGGTLSGGKTPGMSNRSDSGTPQRASKRSPNQDFITGKRKAMATNDLFAAEDWDSEKPPRRTQSDQANIEKRASDYYAKKLRNARRDADKAKLGKRFNGSTSVVLPRYRGRQNA